MPDRTSLRALALTVAATATLLLPAAPAHPATGSPAPAGAHTGAGGNVVVRWNEALLAAVRTGTLGPPQAARALAVVHTCAYDAWAAYDAVAVGTRLGGSLRRPEAERTEANRAEAVSYAAHQAAADLYPAQRPAFDALMTELGYDPADTSGQPARTGLAACSAVLDHRHADGSNQLGGYADTTGYAPVNAPMVVADPLTSVNDPSRWQPLTYRNKAGVLVTPPFLAPHWGGVASFSGRARDLADGVPAPAANGTAAFRAQAAEIVAGTAALTDRQKAIAEYWADGPNSETPPGHWCLFAQQVSARDGHGLDQDVKMFFALANSVMDAGIAAWEVKRDHDSARPITAVRHLYQGRRIPTWGGRVIDGATWVPYQVPTFPTPPFAEYVSGHSTFSGAAAEVLRSFTGGDAFGGQAVIAKGSSQVEPGVTPAADVTLRWHTFSEAADQAGLSRRYGGIHFRAGDLQGRALGRAVGAAAWQRAQAYWSGQG
ncbi:vanadium-dependent haloperoxidase [Nonomuraea sp. SMC257]|uniref:Vanadium-dependent haloperoxidase n=1 Tax=Nonomuraea montanisoli TaxID=2741721 RepID=A0A7Y6M0F5_9ACTN|nr:vanadium-dependent haloperoxidase [Nonomuraea montanisoli]NUW29912.1 vanadium-dependent haloperoxidase [Nonomuraea montanisoli]